ncbi:Protocadherin Fat [Trichinella pseudospiralis]
MKINCCIFRNFKKILLSLATLTLISKAEILPELSGVNAVNTDEHTKDYYKINSMADACSENHCYNGGTCIVQIAPVPFYCKCSWAYEGLLCKEKSVALYLAIAAGVEAIIILVLLIAVIFLCCRIKKIVQKNSSIPIILRQIPATGAEDIPNLYSDEFSKRYSLPSELQIPRPQVVQS